MRKYLISAMALMLTSQLVVAETAEDVQKKIGERSAKHKTIQFKLEMHSKMKQPGFESTSETKGDYKYMRNDDQTLLHADMTTKMDAGMMKTSSTSKMVMDGKFMWTYTDSVTEMGGQKTPSKMVVKNKIDKKFTDPSSMVAMEGHDLKLLPDEKIDGKTAWVIEASSKNPQIKAQSPKTVSWYDQKTGLPLKTIAYGPDGKAVSTTIFSDHKIDEKLDPDLFKFTPPEGVQVMDMTKGA